MSAEEGSTRDGEYGERRKGVDELCVGDGGGDGGGGGGDGGGGSGGGGDAGGGDDICLSRFDD